MEENTVKAEAGFRLPENEGDPYQWFNGDKVCDLPDYELPVGSLVIQLRPGTDIPTTQPDMPCHEGQALFYRVVPQCFYVNHDTRYARMECAVWGDPTDYLGMKSLGEYSRCWIFVVDPADIVSMVKGE